MSVKERGACVEKSNWSPVHLIGSHTYAECNMETDPRYVCAIDGCLKHHQNTKAPSMVSTSSFIASINSTHNTGRLTSSDVLLAMQTVSLNEGTVECQFDNCATCSQQQNASNLVWNQFEAQKESDSGPVYMEVRVSVMCDMH